MSFRDLGLESWGSGFCSPTCPLHSCMIDSWWLDSPCLSFPLYEWVIIPALQGCFEYRTLKIMYIKASAWRLTQEVLEEGDLILILKLFWSNWSWFYMMKRRNARFFYIAINEDFSGNCSFCSWYFLIVLKKNQPKMIVPNPYYKKESFFGLF